MVGQSTILLRAHYLHSPPSPSFCRLRVASNWKGAREFMIVTTWNQKLLMDMSFLKWARTKNHQDWKVCKAESQGFGAQSTRKNKKFNSVQNLNGEQFSRKQLEKGSEGNSQERKTETSPSDSKSKDAPNLLVGSNVQQSTNEKTFNSFEERLEAIKRSAQEKKKEEEEKRYGPIDYDASIATPDAKQSVSFPVKIGLGLAVVIFGLIFVFGDFLPSGNLDVQKPNTSKMAELSSEDAARLKAQLEGFEAILKIHPEDEAALEGAGVTHAELGDYSKAATDLRKLVERRPEDVDALRLLGEVQNALGDFEQGAATYRRALKVSPRGSFTLLQGLVEALVAAGKPNEAVEEILATRERIKSSGQVLTYDGIKEDTNKADRTDEVNPVQIELLLGKVYSEWGHVSDAVAVYDSIITSHPEDFRGYLAKAILLKDQGQKGEAERMFIQARYLAPDKAKSLVERYSKR